MKNTKVQKSKRCENVKSERCENVKSVIYQKLQKVKIG